MRAAWDDRVDPVTEQWQDERLSPGTAWAPVAVGVLRRLLGPLPAYLCEGCGDPVSAQDYADHDGHGPDCPDDSCELRVCDHRHPDPAAHAGCDTEADLAYRDAVQAGVDAEIEAADAARKGDR